MADERFVSPHPPARGRALELLECLAEEAAEVAHRAMKAARFGVAEIQPGQPLTNTQRLAGEVGDLWAVTDLLVDAGLLSAHDLQAARVAKAAKLKKWLQTPPDDARGAVWVRAGESCGWLTDFQLRPHSVRWTRELRHGIMVSGSDFSALAPLLLSKSQMGALRLTFVWGDDLFQVRRANGIDYPPHEHPTVSFPATPAAPDVPHDPHPILGAAWCPDTRGWVRADGRPGFTLHADGALRLPLHDFLTRDFDLRPPIFVKPGRREHRLVWVPELDLRFVKVEGGRDVPISFPPVLLTRVVMA